MARGGGKQACGVSAHHQTAPVSCCQLPSRAFWRAKQTMHDILGSSKGILQPLEGCYTVLPVFRLLQYVFGWPRDVVEGSGAHRWIRGWQSAGDGQQSVVVAWGQGRDCMKPENIRFTCAKIFTSLVLCEVLICKYSLHHCLAYTRNKRSFSAVFWCSKESWNSKTTCASFSFS